MKDNFSSNPEQYAQFRPTYPEGIFQFLEGLVSQKQSAWDCGTGNGQVAVELSKSFRKVYATDISPQQLSVAAKRANIEYSQQAAENTDFPQDFFDLVTVAQAIHWFDFDAFHKEVFRCLKPGGIIAVLGYSLFKSNEETNEVINYFYQNIIGPYWDDERKYLDEEYRTIPFPFEEIAAPRFQTELELSFEHLLGYLNTWSAVKHYEREKGENPVELISRDLWESFGDRGKITHSFLLRVGKNTGKA